jgi:hypothetical protein
MGLQSIASGLHGPVGTCRVARSRGNSDYTRGVKSLPMQVDLDDLRAADLVDEGATDPIAQVSAL